MVQTINPEFLLFLDIKSNSIHSCYPPFIKSYSCYVEHSDFHHFIDDVGHGGHSGGLAHRLHPEGQSDRVHLQRSDRVPQILGQRHLVLHHTAGPVPGGHGGLC